MHQNGLKPAGRAGVLIAHTHAKFISQAIEQTHKYRKKFVTYDAVG